ncbi:hypothetical protein QQ045_019268 [Rhodiola kirilowii]
MDHEHHPMDGMGGMSINTTTTMMHKHSMLTHMTFFWGSQAEILFAGWPGTHTGMYVLFPVRDLRSGGFGGVDFTQ